MRHRSPELRDRTRPRDDRIEAMYRAGMTLPEISRRLRSSIDTARMVLDERGIPRRKRTDEWPELKARNDYIVKAYKRGVPLSEIAEDVGLSQDGARFILNKVRGVPCATEEDRRRANLPRDRRIAALYRRGLTQKQVAGEVGVSQWVVHDTLKRMKVPVRPAAGRKMPEQARWRKLRSRIAGAAHLYTVMGLTTAQIGERLGVRANTVAVNLRRMGVEVRRGKSRLTPGQVRRIRDRLTRGGATSQDLADEHGLSVTTVRAIGTGQSWKDIPWRGGQRYVPRVSAKLDAAKVREIKRLLTEGRTTRAALCRRFKMTRSMLKHIVRGTTWASVPWPRKRGTAARASPPPRP